MLEKPDLADDRIIKQLESQYALRVRALEFLPVGNDQRAWAYRVEADAGVYFLKLRPRRNAAGFADRAAPLAQPRHRASRGAA